MAETWQHPALGQFAYDGDAWTKTIDVPGFAAFSYDTGYSNAPRSTGRHELAFEAEDKNDLPTAGAIAAASSVMANQEQLVSAVTAAFWEDFNGRGPQSGMWWHGALDEVVDGMEDLNLPPLDGPEALRAWLQLSRITVRKAGPHGDDPIVELSFHAAFEVEHGVAVLTDGRAVLGVGYSSDVTPFEST